MFSDLLISYHEGYAVHGNGKVRIWGWSAPTFGDEHFIYKSRVLYILQQDFRPQHEPVASSQSANMSAANIWCLVKWCNRRGRILGRPVDWQEVDPTPFWLWQFCIFGFLDDFAMPTARPGSSATRRHGYESDIQCAFYSGYLGCHGLKAQVVYLPIGVIGSVFITELWQNDSGLLNMSGLNDYLLGLLSGNLVGHLLPCLNCDSIFANLATILPRYTNPTPD